MARRHYVSATGARCSAIVAWKSSNSAVLIVDQSGHVSALTGGGPVTITASVGKQSASHSVWTMTGGSYTVAHSPTTLTLHMGQSVQLNATSQTSYGVRTIDQRISWSSAPEGLGFPEVISVNSTGVVTALSPTVYNPGGVVVNAASNLGGFAAARVFVIP